MERWNDEWAIASVFHYSNIPLFYHSNGPLFQSPAKMHRRFLS
jgi:hypothetical protein